MPVSKNQDFLPWTISIYEKVPGFAERQYKQKKNLYLFTAAAVISILFFGGFLAIRSTAKELKLARMQSEFVSTVSHEFRTPIMSIRYLGELLQRGRVRDEEKKQEYYDIITEESKRLGRLIENTLDFSKIEAGMKKYSFEQIDVAEIAVDAEVHFQKQFLDNRFVLENDIQDSIPLIKGDREALTRALLNLLDNAAKYSGDIRKIILRARSKEDFVFLDVEDFGKGIPYQEQKKVFEKFYRSESIQDSPIKGSGIGLTLVAHTARAHGGEVFLESKEGKGTKITIKLPIHLKKDKNG
jgi:signal transduction histidine kinase